MIKSRLYQKVENLSLGLLSAFSFYGLTLQVPGWAKIIIPILFMMNGALFLLIVEEIFIKQGGK